MSLHSLRTAPRPGVRSVHSPVELDLAEDRLDHFVAFVVELMAGAGYWHFQQMDELTAEGIAVLIPPDSAKRKTARPGWQDGRYSFMRAVLAGGQERCPATRPAARLL